jgi:hypothetical protein
MFDREFTKISQNQGLLANIWRSKKYLVLPQFDYFFKLAGNKGITLICELNNNGTELV